MPNLAGSSLSNIKDFSLEVLTLSDTAFKTATQAIDSGGTLTMAQMTKYQAEVSQYSLISQIMSAVIKELVDSMKAIANKI
jgi:molybdopterin biosynthesis enzyme MoaB